MFYLEKCKYEDCTRHGNVALTENAEFCNIHSNEKEEKKDTDKEVEQNEE